MKTKDKDTSKIYSIQKELNNLLEVNSVVNDEIREKSKLLLELTELRNKEDKGYNRALIFTLVCFALSALSTLFLFEKNKEQSWYVEKLHEFMEVKIDTATNNETLHYRTYNGEKITYNKLGEQRDSMEIISKKKDNEMLLVKLKNDSLSNILWRYKTAYEIINRNYGIEMRCSEIKENEKTTMRVHIEAAKVDSAFLLLPKYGSKISYNKKNDNWSVD